MCSALLVTYLPILQYLDGSGGALILIVLEVTALAFVGLWLFTETRKFIIRTYPDSYIAYSLIW